jgi:uncharacterized membrane protein
MKNVLWGVGSTLLICLFVSCGQNQKSDNKKLKGSDENLVAQEDSAELKNVEEAEFISERKTVNATFSSFALSDVGVIFSFDDENGNEYNFYDRCKETKGMEFVNDCKPNVYLEEYENVWFELTFENRMLEFYNGGSGEYESREGLVILEAVRIGNIENSTLKTGITLGKLKNIVLTGIDPFWKFSLLENSVKYVDATGKEIELYYKDRSDEDVKYSSLEAAMTKKENGSVNIRCQEEDASEVISLTINNEKYNDEKSDAEYPYSVVYDNDGKSEFKGYGKFKK